MQMVSHRKVETATSFIAVLTVALGTGPVDGDREGAGFELVRCAEQLAASQPSIDPLRAALAAAHNLVDERLAALALRASRWQ